MMKNGETTALDQRVNMTRQREENWRPPTFAPAQSGALELAVATMRRFLDLQAGTVWNDLSTLLPTCEGVVLDVGCGDQPYRQLLSPRARYIGIDTADAKAHFGYEMPDTIYFEGHVWPVEDASVDTVLCTETMEHVPDTAGFLAEMARVLRPGGRVILTVPFSARYHHIPHDYWRFTPAGLERIFTAGGFQEIAIYARGNAVTVACYKVMALILPLLFAAAPSAIQRALLRLAGIALSPLLLLLAGIAKVSLGGKGGNDCLGYTVQARRGETKVAANTRRSEGAV